MGSPKTRRLFEIVEEQGGFEPIDNPVERLICNWYRFLLILRIDSDRLSSWLSVEEAHSARILVEWWIADCETVENQQQWRRYLSTSTFDFGADLQDVASLKIFPHPSKRYAFGSDRTMYNIELSTLFFNEFLSTTIPTTKDDREAAALRSYTQRCGSVTYRQIERHVGIEWDDEWDDEWDLIRTNAAKLTQRLTPAPRPCPWLADIKPELPFYFWDKLAGVTVETRDLPLDTAYIAISHTWGRYRLRDEPKINIEGSLWTIPQNSIFDIKEIPSILRQVPGGTRYIWLDLVCIPQDRSAIATREIGRQAQIFKMAKYGIIWLNQMEDFDTLKAAARYMAISLFNCGLGGTDPTIASNAAIQSFRKQCWRQIDSRSSELFAIWPEWDSDEEPEPQPWFTSLWTLQEMCLRPDMWICTRDWQPLTFDLDGEHELSLEGFLSLYGLMHPQDFTLVHNLPGQEHSKSSDGLTDDLIDIAIRYRPASPPAGLFEGLDDFPGRPPLIPLLFDEQLERLHAITGYDESWKASRVRILAMADLKHCSSNRRAEAIMSAIGAVDWYNDYHSSQETSAVSLNLILDKYPVEFVTEVKQKLGARFLMSGRWIYGGEAYSPEGALAHHTYLAKRVVDVMRRLSYPFEADEAHFVESVVQKLTLTILNDEMPQFSLLPFGKPHGPAQEEYEVTHSEASLDMYQDHDSVASWTIMNSECGVFLIPRVAVICSKDILLNYGYPFITFQDVRIMGDKMDNMTKPYSLADFRAFIRAEERNVFAVLTLMHTQIMEGMGVLLERLWENVFVCIGRFKLELRRNGSGDVEDSGVDGNGVDHDVGLMLEIEIPELTLDPPWAVI